MKVSFNELTAKDACKARRSFAVRVTEKKEVSYRRAAVIKETLTELKKETISEKEAKEKLSGRFEAEVGFETKETARLQAEDAFRLIKRYVDSDGRTLVDADYCEIALAPDLTVGVSADYMDIREDGLEVIKLKVGRPITAKESETDLGLYALLCYGREQMKRLGKKGALKASYYFLRKANDSNGKNPNFDENFFLGDTKHIVSIREENEEEAKENDERFRETLERYISGIEKEECSEEDCSRCTLREICHYTEPAMAIKKEAEEKSLSSLTLSEKQQQVVDFGEGVCRVIAGAGAGKTMMLALRVATLILSGEAPEHILVITFTNAGASEIRQRIGRVLKDFGAEQEADKLTVTTFNSFGYSLIKENHRKLGFTEEPALCLPTEQLVLIRELLEEKTVPGLDYRNFTADLPNCRGALHVAAKAFDKIKTEMLSFGDEGKLLEQMGKDANFMSEKEVTAKALIELCREYDERLMEQNLLEYSDQDTLPGTLLREDPYFYEKLGYEHIIVDESQDTSRVQFETVRNLTNTRVWKSTMIVGDDAQSIYQSLRGASPQNILDFDKMIGRPVTDITLTENYRSAPEILEFANEVNDMRRTYRHAQPLQAMRPSEGNPVTVKGFWTKADEMEYVAAGIREAMDRGRAPEDIALIASTKYELMAYADLLRMMNIETVLLNPEPLLENSRVQAALAFSRYCTEQSSRDALIFGNALAGGGIMNADAESLEKLIEEVEKKRAKLFETETEKRRAVFLDILRETDHCEDEVFRSFLDTLSYKPWEKIPGYLNDFAVYGEGTAFRRTSAYPGVALVTAHSSKGMEWPEVFLSVTKFDGPELYTTGGAEKPYMDEKMRLFFVASTRARDRLTVTGLYTAFGKKGDYHNNRFLQIAGAVTGKEFEFSDETIEKKRKEKAKRK